MPRKAFQVNEEEVGWAGFLIDKDLEGCVNLLPKAGMGRTPLLVLVESLQFAYTLSAGGSLLPLLGPYN
jgi:hypothetical protein